MDEQKISREGEEIARLRSSLVSTLKTFYLLIHSKCVKKLAIFMKFKNHTKKAVLLM